MRRPRRLLSDAVPLGDGFSLATRWRTLSRWQLALGDVDEYPLLLERAEDEAARRPTHPHQMVLAIVRRIAAPVMDEAGRAFEAVSEMSAQEVDTCRKSFAAFTELVFACTGGALRVEATELVLEEPVAQLSSTGAGRYWLSATDAFAGRERLIPADELDSLAVFYKMPAGVHPALHGGAVGRDHGVQGSAYWTLWVTDWSEPVGPFSRTVIASLHEWLHNVSFYAQRVMGETAVPDCHAGEEYGYWDTDGGYRQWQAWNRDLMLRYIPRSFWRRLTSRGPLLPPDVAMKAPHAPRGSFFRWRDVEGDWMRRLPQLTDMDLRAVTGLDDLRVVVTQPGPNTHVVWAWVTAAEVESPITRGDPLQASPQFDNVLSVGRLDSPGRQDDPVGGYRSAPLEAMAWLRSPRAPESARDLLLLRVDVAPWILPRLRVLGRPAAESLLGYLARRDPSEGQRVNLLVAAVDFGQRPPKDELDAIGL